MSRKSKKHRRNKSHAVNLKRKDWKPFDPCLKCGKPDAPVIEFSHYWSGSSVYKASCFHCGAYQKFMSEEQVFACKDLSVRDPLWKVQGNTDAPY